MAAPPPPRRRAGADFEIRTLGLRRRLTEDIVHRVLLMPWWRFFALSGLGFLVLNATFAGLYLLQPGSLSGVRPGSFEDAFFFSVQTMATIGY
ncbi:MAG TPA: hypothetical protein VL400_05210, partial [Polyangiaceae bacterium]|nr:hypothetical protein [Polyangiaceae bacterium]